MNSLKYIFEVRHHSLLGSILMGVVLSLIYALYLWWGDMRDFETIVSGSMVAKWIYGWQMEHRLAAHGVIWGVMSYLSIKLGQLAARNNLYGVSSYLPIEIYPLLVMVIMVNASSLKGAIVALLILFSIARYFKSFRAANCAGSLLSGGFALGGATLLYPPAILLWVVVPVMVVLFDRTLREVIVAHLALLIVPFASIYIKWLWGGDFSEIVSESVGALTESSGFSILDSFSGVTIAMLALVLYMTLNAILAISLLESTVKAKRRLRLIAVYALASGAMVALPSADSTTFGLFAVPAAILIPVTMLKFGRLMSFVLYAALFVGAALTIWGF